MVLELRKLTPEFGVEVAGLDLASLSDQAVPELLEKLLQHGLLLFRRQCLHDQDLHRLSGLMGRVETAANANAASPDVPTVVYISNLKDEAGKPIGSLGSDEVTWHSDQYFRETPATLAILHGVLVPFKGGNTHWCSTRLGYEALPPELKQKIAALRGNYQLPATATLNTAPVTHPLVLPHPGSTRHSLYVFLRTRGIPGLPEDEASALIDQLLDYNLREENQYHHSWRAGDVVLYDNGQTLHQRDAFQGLRFMKATRVFLDPRRFPVPH